MDQKPLRTEFREGWKLIGPRKMPFHRPQAQWFDTVPAVVPGHVHLDLQRAGVIPDPFHELHELGSRWIDELDWEYELEFSWSPSPGLDRRVLQFDGIDTIATIELNGQEIGKTDNMFLGYEFDVTKLLVEGSNKLTVKLESAVRVGTARREAYFAENGIPTNTVWFDERAFVRKAGYMSGWDWGPRLVSAGIWKPVRLLEYQSRIKSCSIVSRPLGNGKFKVNVAAEFDGHGELSVYWNGEKQNSGAFEVGGELWWPNGDGKPHLNEVVVEFGGDRVVKYIGNRTIELKREPDEFGTSFEFVVNGRRVWARGANWIPNDSFPSRTTREDLEEQIAKYARLGFNMLRVWGGGVYESEDFYDLCDQHGIMVWQDFPYACSYYPDGEKEQKIAYDEAKWNILRLRGRACLALWCGNNENRALWHGKWQGDGVQPERFFGEPIYDVTLKRAVADHDGYTPYIESSPLLVGNGVHGAGNPVEHSDDHYWAVWHGLGDWVHYADSKTRFSSEFGFASSCSLEAWKQVTDRTVNPDDAAVRWHDKTNKPWDVFRGMVEIHYPHSHSIEDWVYRSQLNQRDAMRFALEHYRANPACRGALIWQVNDCWPVQSWALEDYARLAKPAIFDLQRTFSAVMIAAFRDGTSVKCVVCNDSPEAIKDRLAIRVIDAASGNVVEESAVDVQLASMDRKTFREIDGSAWNPATTVIHLSLEGVSGSDRYVWLCEPKDVTAPAPKATVNFDGEFVDVAVEGFAYDLQVRCPEDEHALIDNEVEVAGCRPISGLNVRKKYRWVGSEGSVEVRTLQGVLVSCSK